jgi:steroid 5-alpha reductase family enzyme
MNAAQFLIGLFLLAVSFSLVMTLAWVIEEITGNSGWIDTIWTFGIGLVGAVSALVPINGEHNSGRRALTAILIVIWALRLGLHIGARTIRRGDDPRYAALRSQYGTQARSRMWYLTQAQAVVSIPMLLAVWLAANNPRAEARPQDFIAICFFIVAVLGEALADHQLQQFSTREPKGVCDVGLWRWSRHPNYFFEWLGWITYPLLATDLSGQYPWGWISVLGPVCMYWLLAYVSGVPPLEAHMLSTRPGFQAYQSRTNRFFPGPRKRAGVLE